MSRLSTGSLVLDSVLNGGFPAGSLVAVTGPPGSGLYASFVEGRKSFIENMRGLGLDFERLERSGRFRFLEMATLKEIGIPAVFEQILGEAADMGASMLVIDSFSAISQVIEKPYDTRILVHTVLSKIVREMGCTTMIIIEKMTAEETYEPAEFLSDFIIHLNKAMVDGALLRCLKILKARGTEIRQPQLAFTLKGGFKVFRPLIMGGLPEPTKRFKLVMHGKDYYSSGIRDLDAIVGAMFRRGCYNLLEFERNVTLTPERLFRAAVSNALNQGDASLFFRLMV